MNTTEVKRRIRGTDIYVWEERRLPNRLGTQFRLSNGAVISIYKTGKVLVQGKNAEETKAALELPKERRKREQAT